jgi:hypothetical protein
MPVNMDPKKKRRTSPEATAPEGAQQPEGGSPPAKPKFGETTERDREHALADAEWKNLWDATEVIDMDKW